MNVTRIQKIRQAMGDKVVQKTGIVLLELV